MTKPRWPVARWRHEPGGAGRQQPYDSGTALQQVREKNMVHTHVLNRRPTGALSPVNLLRVKEGLSEDRVIIHEASGGIQKALQAMEAL